MYLNAAPVLGIDSQRRAVVEDTVAGVVAEITVFAYSPILSAHLDTIALRQVDAHHIFIDMAELVELVS